MKTEDYPCALCLKKLPLSKSHIIPEFFYRLIGKEKQRMYSLSTDPDVKQGRPLTGVYERLLCEKCEALTQAWDGYASRILYGRRVAMSMERTRFGPLFKGLDYGQFKLFQLSLLWRAAASRRPEFRDVVLGEEHEGKLRRMLLDQDPGDPCGYGCLIFASRKKLDITSDMVLMPLCNLQDGSGTCLFLMGGFFLMFSVPTADSQAEQYKFILTKQGEMTIVIEEEATARFLADFAKELKKAGNLPQPITSS